MGHGNRHLRSVKLLLSTHPARIPSTAPPFLRRAPPLPLALHRCDSRYIKPPVLPLRPRALSDRTTMPPPRPTPNPTPAFLPATPLAFPPPPRRPPKTLLHRRPASAYSLPAPLPSPFHSDDTKSKIGLSVHRTVAARQKRVSKFLLSLQPSPDQSSPPPSSPSPTSPPSPDTHPPPSKRSTKPRRRLSAESRAKISAALKGRAKSPEHRASLRKRFVGDRNPMYGRRMSAESRAKISAAMSDLARRKRESKESIPLTEELKQGLRDKAVSSRLLSPSARPRSVGRKLQDHVDEKEVEEILGRVRAGKTPPENVQRAVERDRKMRMQRERKGSASCAACSGSGFVRCPRCVGAFGVASAKCDECFGAGSVFCSACQGAGRSSGV